MSCDPRAVDERLAEVAQQHANETGHATFLMEGNGWLCEECEDDHEEQLREFLRGTDEHPEIRPGDPPRDPNWGSVRHFGPLKVGIFRHSSKNEEWRPWTTSRTWESSTALVERTRAADVFGREEDVFLKSGVDSMIVHDLDNAWHEYKLVGRPTADGAEVET